MYKFAVIFAPIFVKNELNSLEMTFLSVILCPFILKYSGKFVLGCVLFQIPFIIAQVPFILSLYLQKLRLVVHFFGQNDILFEKLIECFEISLYNFKFRRLLVCLFKSSIQFVSEYN